MMTGSSTGRALLCCGVVWAVSGCGRSGSGELVPFPIGPLPGVGPSDSPTPAPTSTPGSTATGTAPVRTLYILDGSGLGCDLSGFFGCLFTDTDFNYLSTGYLPANNIEGQTGEPLRLGPVVRAGSSCAAGDYQCVVNQGGWSPVSGDVVLYVTGNQGSVGGRNDHSPLLASGAHIRYAVIDSGTFGGYANCELVTTYGSHEIFEAINSWSSMDCMDGELPSGAPSGCALIGWNDSCSAACAQVNLTSCSFGGVTGDGSWGITSLHCPNGQSYHYQLLSPGGHEFDGTAVRLHTWNQVHPGRRTGINPDGRMEVFSLAAGATSPMQHLWQLDPNGRWSSFDQSWGAPPGTSWLSDPVTRNDAAGGQEVFAVGADQALYQKYFTQSTGWSGWNDLGGSLAGEPAIGMNKNDALELFAASTEGHLVHSWQAAPGAPGSFTAWSDLGRPSTIPLPGVRVASRPAVCRDSSGALEVFLVGSDAVLWQIAQTGPEGSWGGWASFGAPSGEPLSNDPECGADADGRLEVFVTGQHGSLYQRWQSGAGWSAWATALTGVVGDPAVARHTVSGRLEVVIRTAGGALAHSHQTTANGSWSVDPVLPVSAASNPDLSVNADGRLEVHFMAPGGSLHAVYETTNDGAWSAETDLGGSLRSF